MRLGELTLKVYTDIALAAANSASFNYELVSREQTLTPQGLAAEVPNTPRLAAPLSQPSFFYLDENGIGFHATYLAPIDRYDELRELITHSFGMFRDGSAPPAPALTLTPGPESEDRRGAAVSISVDLPTTELEASTTVSFQITIKNEGSDSVVLVRIRSFLPPNFKFVPGSTGGDLTSRDPTILIGQTGLRSPTGRVDLELNRHQGHCGSRGEDSDLPSHGSAYERHLQQPGTAALHPLHGRRATC